MSTHSIPGNAEPDPGASAGPTPDSSTPDRLTPDRLTPDGAASPEPVPAGDEPPAAGSGTHLAMPLDPDRPVVDGTTKSSDQIRAEMAALLEEDRRLDEQRAGVAETVGEFAARQDGTARSRAAAVEPVARVNAAKDQAVAKVNAAKDQAVAKVQAVRDQAVPKVQAATGEAVATMAHQVERARTALPETVSTVADVVQRKPVLVGGGAAVAVVAVVLVGRWMRAQ